MKYLFFKTCYKVMWLKVKSRDKKRFKNLRYLSNVNIKSLEFDVTPHELTLNKTLKYNIYSDNNRNNPLLIDIHGGGWAHGDKDVNHEFCSFIASSSIDVLSLSYTLTFKAELKHQIYEINDFIRYLIENSQKLNLNTNKIFLTGDSAGAQLILLYTLLSKSSKLREAYNLKDIKFYDIDGLILNHGAYYLSYLGELKNKPRLSEISINGVKRMLLGKDYMNFPYLDPDSMFKVLNEESVLESFPKTIIISSLGDSLNTHSFKLKNLMDSYNLNPIYIYEDDNKKGHIFNVIHPFDEKETIVNNKICNFIKELSK